MTTTTEPTTTTPRIEHRLTASEWRHAASLVPDIVRERVELALRDCRDHQTLAEFWGDDIGNVALAIGRGRRALAGLNVDEETRQWVAEALGLDILEAQAWELVHRVLDDLGMLNADDLGMLVAEVQA